MTLIVGLGHVAQTGKDTAAAVLVKELGFTKFGFADPLVQLAMEADPLVTAGTRTVNTAIGHGRFAHTVKGLGYEGAKGTYPEVRRFLQNLGVGARKVFGQDFWVEQLMAQIARKNPPKVVISDVRFENEALAIRKAGGVVVRIDRPGKVASGHVSETELVDFDFDKVIANATTIEDFQANVVTYVEGLFDGVPTKIDFT